MEHQGLEKGLFNFTAGILGVFTLVLAFNLLSFKPPAKASSNAARTPAAVNTTVTDLKVNSPTQNLPTPSNEFPCFKDGLVHNISATEPRIRLNLQLCKKAQPISESLIVNKTNGFMATVFKLSPQSVITDLIDLTPGENHIHISHQLENGSKLLGEVVIHLKE